MIHMLYVLLIHIVMDIFEVVISMIKHILYVIIIMLIYGIKMIQKMTIFLTVAASIIQSWSTLSSLSKGNHKLHRQVPGPIFQLCSLSNLQHCSFDISNLPPQEP
jgi:purine-cytosine permease-like protein